LDVKKSFAEERIIDLQREAEAGAAV